MDGLNISEGATLFPGHIDRVRQEKIRDDVRDVIREAPLFTPSTRSGRKMSVRMTSAGKFGWFSDTKGYRYIETHPSGVDWPEIPAEITRVWDDLAGTVRQPECCLINFYTDQAKMGMHQDRDEASFDYPVLSISLGDDALFRIGSTEHGGKTTSHWLRSGDVLLMGGAARLAWHGIDRVRPGSSNLLRNGGRLNLTLRVVT